MKIAHKDIRACAPRRRQTVDGKTKTKLQSQANNTLVQRLRYFLKCQREKVK